MLATVMEPRTRTERIEMHASYLFEVVVHFCDSSLSLYCSFWNLDSGGLESTKLKIGSV